MITSATYLVAGSNIEVLCISLCQAAGANADNEMFANEQGVLCAHRVTVKRRPKGYTQLSIYILEPWQPNPTDSTY